MGVKPASGEFMSAIRNHFSDIPGLHAAHDDKVSAGTTIKDHDKSIYLFLKRLLARGMTLNPDKCIFSQREIPLWGMQVSAMRPDPEKVQNLKDAPMPKTKDELISFLCMARSHSAFIPFIARETP